jgi:hypothetical protein
MGVDREQEGDITEKGYEYLAFSLLCHVILVSCASRGSMLVFNDVRSWELGVTNLCNPTPAADIRNGVRRLYLNSLGLLRRSTYNPVSAFTHQKIPPIPSMMVRGPPP